MMHWFYGVKTKLQHERFSAVSVQPSPLESRSVMHNRDASVVVLQSRAAALVLKSRRSRAAAEVLVVTAAL